MWWWDSRPIHEPTASADVVTRYGAAGALSAAASSVQLEGASDHSGSVWAAGGRDFEHLTPHMVPCGGGTVARSISRPPQPDAWS